MSEANLRITEFTPGNEVAKAQLDAKIARLEADVKTLRRMLAFAYAGPYLYGDDGELQDSRNPPIDFVRDTVAEIDNTMHKRAMQKLAEAACPECRVVQIPGFQHHKAECSQGNGRAEPAP